jgi:hypothetical protein
MTAALTSIRKAQQAWAEKSVGVDRGCTYTLNDNLFRPLHPETLEEFRRGSGDETGHAANGKKRAKMLSLRSSSVLAVNVFDYWRGRDLTKLARALGADGDYTELKFEQPFDHGLPTGKPHLDVVLYQAAQRQPFTIECKFAEPYDINKHYVSPPIAEKYFEGDRTRWTDVGLPRCQALASDIGHTIAFRRLGAVQLLKHILGIANDKKGTASAGSDVPLLYLWFDTLDTEAAEHERELDMFKKRLDPGLDFRAMTYQALFARLAVVAEPNYVAYLRARYFPPVTSP